jgi:prohibitin 2
MSNVNIGNKTIFMIVGGVVALVLVLSIAGSLFKVIDPGHRGVKVSLGTITEESIPEGLHFKWPWVTIHEISIQEQIIAVQTGAASSDLQTVRTGVAVNYRPEPESVWLLFQNIGRSHMIWESTKLDPIITESVKAVTARYTAENLIVNREAVKLEIEEVIRRRAQEESWILVTSVNITDFLFSEIFDQAIEAKVQAEQDALRAENELRRHRTESQKQVVTAEADKQVRQFKAQAERIAVEEAAAGEAMRIELTSVANAEAIKREAEAEAEANRMLLETLDRRVLENKRLDRWDGKLPRVSGGDPLILIDPERD